jgi:DNA repair exonuclease SbcCD ATPase subunit
MPRLQSKPAGSPTTSRTSSNLIADVRAVENQKATADRLAYRRLVIDMTAGDVEQDPASVAILLARVGVSADALEADCASLAERRAKQAQLAELPQLRSEFAALNADLNRLIAELAEHKRRIDEQTGRLSERRMYVESRIGSLESLEQRLHDPAGFSADLRVVYDDVVARRKALAMEHIALRDAIDPERGDSLAVELQHKKSQLAMNGVDRGPGTTAKLKGSIEDLTATLEAKALRFKIVTRELSEVETELQQVLAQGLKE